MGIGYDYDWEQISKDCGSLAGAWFVTGIEEDIWTHKYELLTWGEFWRHAQAWSSAQLSPSQLMKMHDREEKDAAKRRLENYCFGDDWLIVPQRAQRALVSADKAWNSKEVGRIEAIFNELRIATEEMCSQYIWRPLGNLKSGEWFPEMDMFEQRRQEMEDKNLDPDIRDFIWTFEQKFCREFLAQRNLASCETQFLTEELPAISRQLMDTRRNIAEHKLDKVAQRDAVEEVFKKFLGIGQPGILPALARIAHKLQTSAK